MVKYILFVDTVRQEEIETFYTVVYLLIFLLRCCLPKACQKHRDFYRGYPKCYHPLAYFRDPQFMWQCPPEMSNVYLGFPPYHVKYRQPAVLPPTLERTSFMPTLPDRSLAGRFNKAPCKVFTR